MKSIGLISLLFLALCGLATAQTAQNFPSYVTGLPSAPATGLNSTDLLYLQQGSTATKVTNAFLAAIPSFPVDRYGARGDGATDDSAAFAAAATACNAAKQGAIVVGPKRYVVDNSITIPIGCQVWCPAPLEGNRGGVQTNISTMPAVILNGNKTITMLSSSGWIGCALLQKAVASSAPNTIRLSLTQTSSFAGVGLTLGVSSGTAADITIRDALIAGFTCGVIPGGNPCTTPTLTPSGSSAAMPRLHMDHVNIDAYNCVWVNNAHDIVKLINVECAPHMLFGKPQTEFTTISGIANDGGVWQVTASAATSIQTGDAVWVSTPASSPLVGPNSAQNKWIATAVDSTHIDLQGSTSTATVTPGGTQTNGNNLVTGVSSLAGIGIGDTITAAGGVPGGTTIVAIWPTAGALVLSANTTSSVSQTYTVTQTPYASGGRIYLDATYYFGTAFTFTNSEGVMCSFCFDYGHRYGFEFGVALQYFDCIGCWTDNQQTDDPNSKSIVIDGATVTQAIKFTGGTLISKGEVVSGNGPSGGAANTLIGTTIANNQSHRTVMELLDGSWQIIGVSHPTGSHNYWGAGSTIDRSSLVGNNALQDTITYAGSASSNISDVGNQWHL